MDINAAFPSKYLKAADLQGREVSVTISHITMEDIGDGEQKPTLYFQGKAKGLVLNKTNAGTIADQHGYDTDFWINKQIVLFPTQTDYAGKQVPCIRVKLNTIPAGQPPAGDVGAAPPPIANVGGNTLDDEIPF